MGEFGIRLEAGVDAACDDPRVLAWIAAHDVTPTNTYALDVFQTSLTAHCYHVNKDGTKHLRSNCDRQDDESIVSEAEGGDDICRCKFEREMIIPFPAGVMAGPGHEAAAAKAALN